mmetsp:Transcript_30900/g.50464  ORF Transcript_30900/g.50464 Transcript_30900/m.50464 type:complete len:297 (+) Transcript_30900:281-1171(+)
MKWDAGAVYHGEWKGDKMHGRGTYKYAGDDEAIYEGEFMDSVHHGKGKMKYSNGQEYEGKWKNDREHGMGTMKCASGSLYVGGFKKGNAHGSGKIKYGNEEVYEGEFENGQAYEGELRDGKKHGTGTLRYANGDVYEGDFEDDVKHGTGEMKKAGSDDVFKQIYNHGELLSSKRRGILIGGSPSRRIRTNEAVDIVVLTDGHKTCQICFNEFSFDMNSDDESIKRRLPVLSSCDHRYCHGCVLNQQVTRAEGKHGRVPKRIKCMHCRKNAAFCPSEPKYDRQLIDLLNCSIPVRVE